MKTTFVYRIEHAEQFAVNIGTDRKIKGVNRGPYINNDALSDMCDAHNDDYTHPSVRDDISKWYSMGSPYKYICCFKTKKQMKTWFRGWFGVLHSEGFVLVKYVIEKDALIMGRSNRQGVFNSKKIIERKIVSSLDSIK